MAEKIFTALSEMAEFLPMDANVHVICLKVTDLAGAAVAEHSLCSPPPPSSPTRACLHPAGSGQHAVRAPFVPVIVMRSSWRGVFRHLQGQSSNKFHRKCTLLFSLQITQMHSWASPIGCVASVTSYCFLLITQFSFALMAVGAGSWYTGDTEEMQLTRAFSKLPQVPVSAAALCDHW